MKNFGINIDLIDIRSIKPLDLKTIVNSLTITGKLLVLDTGASTCSVASDIISKLTTQYFDLHKVAPARLTMPDTPEPTSFALTKNFYIRAADIAEKVLEILGINGIEPHRDIPQPDPHDVPGDWFKGPF